MIVCVKVKIYAYHNLLLLKCPIFGVIYSIRWSAYAYYRTGRIFEEFCVSRVLGNFSSEYENPIWLKYCLLFYEYSLSAGNMHLFSTYFL